MSIPTSPPTPWQGNTSSVSSREVLDFQCTTMLLISEAKVPINRLEGIVTKPAAGVIATRPTTAPIQNPRADGFLPRSEERRVGKGCRSRRSTYEGKRKERVGGVGGGRARCERRYC